MRIAVCFCDDTDRGRPAGEQIDLAGAKTGRHNFARVMFSNFHFRRF